MCCHHLTSTGIIYRCVPRHQSSAYIVPPTGFKPTSVQPIAVTATWLHNSRVVRIFWGAWEAKIELIVFKMLFNISLSHAQDCLPWYIAIAWLQTVVQWRVVSGKVHPISQVVYKFVLGLTMDAAEDEKCLSPSVSRRETRGQTLSWNLLVCCQHAPCLLAATNINLEWTLRWFKPMGRNRRLFSLLFDFAPANKFCTERNYLYISLLFFIVRRSSTLRSNVPTCLLRSAELFPSDHVALIASMEQASTETNTLWLENMHGIHRYFLTFARFALPNVRRNRCCDGRFTSMTPHSTSLANEKKWLDGSMSDGFVVGVPTKLHQFHRFVK